MNNATKPARHAKALERVAGLLHQQFLDAPDGQRYLRDRGLDNPGLFTDYRIGYADGSLAEKLPTDKEARTLFREIGVLEGRGKDAFAGCVVFKLVDAAGATVNLYGRRIKDGAAQHVFALDDRRGTFNYHAARRAKSVIICGSVIDALTLIDRGMPDVIPCLRGDGLNDEQVALFQGSQVERVILCLRGGPTSEALAQVLIKQFDDLGLALQRAALPDGEDLNSFLAGKEITALQALLPKFEAAKAKEASRCQRTERGVIVHRGPRCYEVTAFVKQGTQLRATVRATGGPKPLSVRTLDLYSASSREKYASEGATYFNEERAIIRDDVDFVLEELDAWEPPVAQSKQAVVLTEEERGLGESLLRDPKLLDRIKADLTTMGVAGEDTNKLLCYLAATSRKLEDPLSLLIHSRSAAGKSTLQDAVLSLVPPEEKRTYTRMTDQALFYQEHEGLKNKIIAVEEDDGVGGADYSLRALQSAKQLVVATTSKDSFTGKLKADEHVVKGPIAVMLTTTSPLDEETASRFLTVTIDESVEMTGQILVRQREATTLAGHRRRLERDAVVARHLAAQRMLEPIAVINNYGPQLSFTEHPLRARRDNKKYLTLIETIAFLHQKQRPVIEDRYGDRVLRYIEVTPDDIRIANKLIEAVLAQSMSELTPPARKLLDHIHTLVKAHCAQKKIAPKDFAFTRKTIRESCGWTDYQVRTHVKVLQELEYVRARKGSWGKEYFYELATLAEIPAADTGLGLTDPSDLKTIAPSYEGETVNSEGTPRVLRGKAPRSAKINRINGFTTERLASGSIVAKRQGGREGA